MPTKLITEDRDDEVVLEMDVTDLLFTEDGSPTFQAEAISDFLTHVDFSELFESPALHDHVVTILSEEDGEDDEEEDDEEEEDGEEDEESEDDDEKDESEDSEDDEEEDEDSEDEKDESIDEATNIAAPALAMKVAKSKSLDKGQLKSFVQAVAGKMKAPAAKIRPIVQNLYANYFGETGMSNPEIKALLDKTSDMAWNEAIAQLQHALSTTRPDLKLKSPGDKTYEGVAEAMDMVSAPQDMAKAKKGLEQAGVENIRKVRLAKDTRWPGAGSGVIWKKGRMVFIGDHPSLGLSVWHDQMGKPQGIQRHEFMEAGPSTVYPHLSEELSIRGMELLHSVDHVAMKEGQLATLPYMEEDGYIAPFQQFLDGDVVVERIDADDLCEMFLDYLDQLAESASTLSERVQIEILGRALLGEEAPFKKGAFKKLARKKVGHAQVLRMMGAMLKKGAIKRVPDGTGYKGGGYMKDTGYRTGGKKSKQAQVDRYKKTNKAKLKASARKARRRVKEGVEDDFLSIDEVPIFGLAAPVSEGMLFTASVIETDEEETQDTSESIVESIDPSLHEPKPVVNHSGGPLVGAQLAEAVIHRGPREAGPASNGPISEGASLANRMLSGRMALPSVDESKKLTESTGNPDQAPASGASLASRVVNLSKKS